MLQFALASFASRVKSWRYFLLFVFALGLQGSGCDCGPDPSIQPDTSCRFNSDCPNGQECDPDSHQCVTATSGYCDVDDDCLIYGVDLYCETDIHLCVSHHECGDDNPCPDPDQECQVDEGTGYRVCVYPGCDGDDACIAELGDSCAAGTRARCVLRECICQDACGGPCGEDRLCCANSDSPTCIDDPGFCAEMSCEPGYARSVASEVPWSVDACDYDGQVCDCQELPPLPLGDIGDPSVLAARSDGSLVLAAYNFGFDHDPNFDEQRYGDLMLGLVSASGTIDWTTLDGVPDAAITAGPSGPRGGIIEPGDDVGRQLDMAVDSADRIHIAYWDRTNMGLKYARVSADGSSITIIHVDDQGDTGRAPAIVIDPGNDAPRIAYFSKRIDRNGQALSELRVAVAAVPQPTTASQFALHTAASLDLETVPCQGTCPDGQVCQDAPEGSLDFCVSETQDCGGCVDPQACVNGSCVDVIAAPLVENPAPGPGLFSDIAVRADGRLVIVAYDSFAGDLLAYTPNPGVNLLESGASFTATHLDGDLPSDSPHDVGAHVQVAVSGNILHLVYTDASDRSLISASLDANLQLTDRVVLDDGRRPGPAGAWDQHPLSDPAIAMNASGQRSVVYQDGTVQSLWSCSADSGENFSGCQWLQGGEPGALYSGSYGYANNIIYLPGQVAPIISSYRFVPVSEGPYPNGVVLINYPDAPSCQQDLYEANDSLAQATDYPLASLPGRICTADMDWFKIHVLSGDKVRARIAFSHAQGDLDMSLFDAAEQELVVSDSGSDDEQVDYESTTEQDLYIKIFGYQGASNSYILQIDLY